MPDYEAKKVFYVPLTPAILVALAIVIKAALLPHFIYGHSSVYAAAAIAANDLSVFALLMLCGLVCPFFRSQNAALLRVISAAGAVWFAIDTAVLLTLHTRVGVVELLQYSTELPYTREGKICLLGLPALMALMAFSRIGLVMIKRHTLLLPLFFLLLFVPQSGYAPELQPFGTKLKFNLTGIVGQEIPRFTFQEVKALLAEDEPLAVSQRPNIILIVVESLSAADSFRISGVADHLPLLDRLSYEGILYRNFFANSINTEGAIISLIRGIPPLQHSGSSWDLYDSFSAPSSNAKVYADYHTEFISTSDLNFRGEREFLRRMKIKAVHDVNNTPAFRDAPRFAFDAASDEVLYSESLKVLARSCDSPASPCFLILETVSSHRPYIHPEGRPANQENIWSYTERQIYRFYEELRAQSFFENGFLVIVGDHRDMRAVSTKERSVYGATAEWRVPLIVIGRGIPAGAVDDRLLQQSDLIAHIFSLVDSRPTTSTAVILLPHYRKPLFGDGPAEALVIYDSVSGRTTSKGTYFGPALAFSPPLPLHVEKELKRKLAVLQHPDW